MSSLYEAKKVGVLMEQQVEAVQSMQDYIEKHVMETITPSQLARVSFFSPWYSCRIFKDLTGYTPSEYIRRLRLSKSALKLREGNLKVIDVAFEMGFKSVDGYQRAFYREFHCNPHTYAQNPIPLQLFIPYGVKYKALKEVKSVKDKVVVNVFIQTIEKPERKVIIKRGVEAKEYFAYCDEVGCDVWGLLTSIPDSMGEPVCLWLPDKYVAPGTSKYVQGVEVEPDYQGEIPEGFDVISLPACKYLMFQSEPFREEDYCEVITNVQSSMDEYDTSIIGLVRDEDNPRIQLEPRGERGYIEMFAVK